MLPPANRATGWFGALHTAFYLLATEAFLDPIRSATSLMMHAYDETRAKQAHELITEKYFQALKQVLDKLRDEL